MALHKHEPCSLEELLQGGSRYTICENFREMWKIVQTLDDSPETEELETKIRIGVTMAKRIVAKLKEYNEEKWVSERSDFYNDARMMNIKRNNMLSHKHRTIFMAIPKNASTALKNAFAKGWGYYPDNDVLRKDALRQDERGEIPYIDMGAMFYWQRRSYRSIAVVRNPYARLVSAWYDKVYAPTKQEEDPTGLPTSGMEFPEFVRFLRDQPIERYNYHFIPQFYYICFLDKKGRWRIAPSLVLKLEQLDKTWHQVASYTGMQIPLPEKGINARSERKPWKEYYGPEEQKIVREIYEQDFTFFYSGVK